MNNVTQDTKLSDSSQDRSSTLEKILDWSETLPDWQSDSLRRILYQDKISEQDISDILNMLKVNNGITDLKQIKVTPKRLSKTDIPVRASTTTNIYLDAMRDLINVNIIAPGQTLKFGREGITIIYGDNSAGKSGYARVLKKACRARGEDKPILPNVFSDVSSDKPANATIDIFDGKETKPIKWVEYQASSDELASIAVFDIACARIYVDEANEVAYVPYGLDVFDKLAKLCERLKSILQDELQSLSINRDILQELQGDTIVGKLIETVDHNTPIKSIEDLAEMSEAEKRELDEIERKLAEIKIKSPKAYSESLRIKKRRIERILGEIEKIRIGLAEEEIEKIKSLQSELNATKKAIQFASKQSFESEPLSGVTSEPWKIMFEAARQYSEQYTYPGESFPVTKTGARCVLCFQLLSQEASERLIKFQEFVQDKTEQQLRIKQKEFNDKVSRIKGIPINPFSSDPELLKEIEELDPKTASIILEYLDGIKSLYDFVLESIKAEKWDIIPALSISPLKNLDEIIGNLEEQAKKYDAITEDKEIIALKKECDNLNSRRQLAKNKDKVINYIESLKKREKNNACIRATNTTGISRKGAELMKQVITDQLKEHLINEFKGLDIGHIKVDLNKIGREGVTFHQLKLKSKTHPSASLSEVFSEGEQNAIAIASFLAELQTSPSTCGIILDDPVSSLDHLRRDKVAVRLANEAKKRQVIVFTHDLVFLMALEEKAKEQGVQTIIQTVWTNYEMAGFCDPSAPWYGKKVNDRMSYLKNRLVEIKKAFKEGKKDEQERMTEDCYKKLRETCERAIEEVIFNDSIKRFRLGIETNRLKAVSFGDEDFKFVNNAISKYSECVHDQSPARGIRNPKPDELELDIKELEEFISRVRKRQDSTQKQR
jgi:ABC-type lipoprotein export system ATPase subunit